MALLPSVLSAAFAAVAPLRPAIRSWKELAERSELQGASLAIVGNAGYLAERAQGRHIDGHDLVLRMNNFQIAGFEHCVGRKLDIFFTTFHDDVDVSNPALAQARFIVTSVPFNVTKRRGAGLQHRHAKFIAAGLRKMQRQEAFVPDEHYFLAAREEIGRYPSTGAMAILLAIDYLLPRCGPVSITGFSFFQGRSHYFSSRAVDPRNHDPEHERALLRRRLAPHLATGRVRVDDEMARQLQVHCRWLKTA